MTKLIHFKTMICISNTMHIWKYAQHSVVNIRPTKGMYQTSHCYVILALGLVTAILFLTAGNWQK